MKYFHYCLIYTFTRLGKDLLEREHNDKYLLEQEM